MTTTRRCRIRARRPAAVQAPGIDRDGDLVASFLSDAAHVPGGFAAGVAFPRDEGEVAALVAAAERVLPVGAQSSLTGGATPRGDVVLSTRALTFIGEPSTVGMRTEIRVGAGVPLQVLQRTLAARGWYYPPVPTYDGAFVGGTVATNAAGAATFKYGSTRAWVAGLTVVLANGTVLDLRRGEVAASPDGVFEIEDPWGEVSRLPLPHYEMPHVAKLSAGYYNAPGMDLVDLFIGSEGTLGVVVDAALQVIPRPQRAVALITCASDALALQATAALRSEAHRAWRADGPLDVAAIEYMDSGALALVGDVAFGRAGIRRPPPDAVLLLVQLEVDEHLEQSLLRFEALLAEVGIAGDPVVAMPGDEFGQRRLFELREAVPASLNSAIGAAKAGVDAAIEKTAGDMIVPFERLADSLACYRRLFEQRGLPYAIWGHVSDGNLHPNVVPASRRDVELGHEAILEIGREVMAMGGAPLAEHGVGRSLLKQRLLRDLYGDVGIAEMRAVKRAVDPGWKLAPGVLFPITAP